MFRSDFRKKGVCSKSATKTLYSSKFLVMECIFTSELQVIKDWLCARDIAETSLNRLLLFLILKSSHRRCSVEKSVLKSFTGKYLCCSLFSKNLQAGEPATQGFSNDICKLFKNIYFEERLYLYVTLFTVYEKETANEAWVKPSQTYLIEFFAKAVKLLALNYFLKKVLS